MTIRLSKILVLLGCMVVTGYLCAQTATEAGKQTATQQKQPEKHSPPATKSPRQPAKPAATFKPTEQIGADSAVSFPVDI